LGNKERHAQVSEMLCQKVKRNVDTVEVKTQGAGNLEHCVELLKNDQNRLRMELNMIGDEMKKNI
jgi:hypothetical protein